MLALCLSAGVAASAETERVLPHPQGCPSRNFCGCGAAVELFGSPVKDLWSARAWLRFPRAEAASGMVAVRAHHVMVLRAHLIGPWWFVYDANGGRHLTYYHVRNIRGYTIVNPRH